MQITIDTDTRQMKRVDGGYTTGAGKFICDHCAVRILCTVTPTKNICPLFMPALPFTVQEGMGHEFNTVRIGRAWTQRLKVGQTVALYNSKTKRIFGYAKVQTTFAGPIVEMLKKHAADNHLMLGKTKKAAAKELGAWMRQNYGPRIVHENTTVTAIYLLRLHEPPLAPHLQGLEAPGVSKGGAADPRKAGRE